MSTNYMSNKMKAMFAAYVAALSGVKLMLVTSSYTPDKDNQFASSATAAEISTTNYAGGYGGGGRKTVGSMTASEDDALDLGKLTFGAVAWTALGPASAGPTTAYALLVQETGGSDATSPILATYDVVRTLNGSDLTLTPAATGALTIA